MERIAKTTKSVMKRPRCCRLSRNLEPLFIKESGQLPDDFAVPGNWPSLLRRTPIWRRQKQPLQCRERDC